MIKKNVYNINYNINIYITSHNITDIRNKIYYATQIITEREKKKEVIFQDIDVEEIKQAAL